MWNVVMVYMTAILIGGFIGFLFFSDDINEKRVNK